MSLLLLPLLLLFNFQDPVDPKQGEETLEAMIILQEITGRPGRPDDEVELQQMVLARDRLLLEDRSRGVVSILRLDAPQPVLREISADGSAYRESLDLGRIQKDRQVQEQQLVERSRDLPQKERLELLRASHIRLSD